MNGAEPSRSDQRPAETLFRTGTLSPEASPPTPPAADSGPAETLFRRSWPQRLSAFACTTVIACALVSHYWIDVTYGDAQKVVRINFAAPPSGTDAGSAAVEAASATADERMEAISWAGAEDGRPLLQTETPADAPVNFLIVGTDSALGVDADDPVLHGRYVDPKGRSRADAIMLVRLDPASGSGWVLSIPRDLWVEIPRGQENRINSALWIGGAPLLVETVTETFQIEVNHYVQVDFAGFQSLVDALGGVPVWFPRPARDEGARLDIPTAGCHVLNGRQALQYVRGRHYTELVRGEWRVTGGSDLHRIERQQDFVVLILNRAVKRGVRNPGIMAELLESVIDMVALDQDLTVAELLELGSAFKDFDPSELHRQRLEVYTVRWPDGGYKGEAAHVSENQAVLDVFRGRADEALPDPSGLSASHSPPQGVAYPRHGSGAAGGGSGSAASAHRGVALLAANSVSQGAAPLIESARPAHATAAGVAAANASQAGRPLEGELCE